MATTDPKPSSQYLRAVIDMGSNGVRFSISTLQPPLARLMPTLYQTRANISLYDAQYHPTSGARQPIDAATISAVINSFTHFQQTCADFGVPDEHITVLATEATRTAPNSEEFRERIKSAVGWDVRLLPKAEEGRIGTWGIASSLPEVSGLVMDLGGGSTQLSWLDSSSSRVEIQMPAAGAVSMPFGAAALGRRLEEAEKAGSTEVVHLREEIVRSCKEAYRSLDVPEGMRRAGKEKGGFTMYLSGGGFRGWGYLLMSRHHVQPYPLPVINGFRADHGDFTSTAEIRELAATQLQDEETDIFRVSNRRASQVPAVAFLIDALMTALPKVRKVRFCQGGVREGYLFSTLDAEVRAQHPLVVATQPHRTTSSDFLVDLLSSALPSQPPRSGQDDYHGAFPPPLLQAFANMMYYHSSYPKDLQASSALRSTTSGVLASVHGIIHENRALLALLLCARWGGDVSPSDQPFKQNLEKLFAQTPWVLWWVGYLGAVADLVAAAYPAGTCSDQSSPRVKLDASWSGAQEEDEALVVRISTAAGLGQDFFEKEVKGVEKIGKKKRWIGGKSGTGHKVVIESGTIP